MLQHIRDMSSEPELVIWITDCLDEGLVSRRRLQAHC